LAALDHVLTAAGKAPEFGKGVRAAQEVFAHSLSR